MQGEEAAARCLCTRGYEIRERNWKCPAGEVDLIAKNENAIVFVEVKTRADTKRGFPSEAASSEKRKRYEKIALAYLAESGAVALGVRFDVAALVVLGENRALIRHHINAFASC